MTKHQNLKSVLFINFGGIGDEILFFPTLKDFKEKYPDTKLTLMLEPRSSSCLQLTDTIDETVQYDVKTTNKIIAFINLIRLVRKGRYDAVISAGSNKLISLLLFLSGSKIRIGYDSGTLSQKLLSSTVGLNKKQYAAKMYHDLLKGIGIDKDTPDIEVIVPDSKLSYAKELIGETTKKTIIIHPGVSKLSVKKNIIKSWPEDKWSEVIIKLLDTNLYRVILAGGPDDEDTIKHIRANLKDNNVTSSDFIDVYGKTKNLSDLAALLKLSDILICVDSAPMHIGLGVNTNIVAIFGPTDEKKLVPEKEGVIVVKNNDIECRPCLWDKQNEVCKDISCLNITVQQIVDAINTLQNAE